MSVQRSKGRDSRYDNMLAANKVRLFNPETSQYLHLSATKETKGTIYAWLGFQYQANALCSKARQAGNEFPYISVHRDDCGEFGPKVEAMASNHELGKSI